MFGGVQLSDGRMHVETDDSFAQRMTYSNCAFVFECVSLLRIYQEEEKRKLQVVDSKNHQNDVLEHSGETTGEVL